MIIRIDMQSQIPLYEQLCTSVIQGIVTKELTPGESMPSVRKLGVDLGINLHTVNKAYTQLKQKGYLSIHRNKGVVVNDESYYMADKDFINKVESILTPILSECLARKMSKADINKIIENVKDNILRGDNNE